MASGVPPPSCRRRCPRSRTRTPHRPSAGLHPRGWLPRRWRYRSGQRWPTARCSLATGAIRSSPPDRAERPRNRTRELSRRLPARRHGVGPSSAGRMPRQGVPRDNIPHQRARRSEPSRVVVDRCEPYRTNDPPATPCSTTPAFQNCSATLKQRDVRPLPAVTGTPVSGAGRPQTRVFRWPKPSTSRTDRASAHAVSGGTALSIYATAPSSGQTGSRRGMIAGMQPLGRDHPRLRAIVVDVGGILREMRRQLHRVDAREALQGGPPIRILGGGWPAGVARAPPARSPRGPPRPVQATRLQRREALPELPRKRGPDLPRRDLAAGRLKAERESPAPEKRATLAVSREVPAPSAPVNRRA